MRWRTCLWLAAAGWAEISCSHPQPPAQTGSANRLPEPVKITQFYVTSPTVARGEKELVCYGVENAKSVTLQPPRQELSASPSRCVEVSPTANTTYTLTAEGEGGPVSKTLTVTMGAPKVKIVEVKVSTLDLKAGDQLSICYKVENARSVEIQPIGFHGGPRPDACEMTSPRQTTTYVVRAVGAGGDRDQERVTVKVH